MKLLQRTGLYFMGFSLLILIVGGISIFYALEYMLDHEMDENLHHTRSVLYKELSERDSLPPVVEIMDEVIDIQEIPELYELEIYRDTFRLVEDDGESELEPYRQYIYTERINGKPYRIALNHSKFDNEHFLVVITALIIGFLFFFFLILNLFNRFLSQRLWQPFYHTIRQIRHFSLAQPQPFSALPTDIDEFKTLENALEQMTQKLLKDYRSLKQFTENASHEIQTPLAIIKSQVELLLQKEQDENSLKHLTQIQQSASKLSKLNQALLLLTRIENRQFQSVENIALDLVITQKLIALDILIAAKSIQVQQELQEVHLSANALLMDVVVSNLLSNAIKYTVENGEISIRLDSDQLLISNTGEPLSKAPQELFERFKKSDDSGKSVGLGLAIVKEICEMYQWAIDYKTEGDRHIINIRFNLAS